MTIPEKLHRAEMRRLYRKMRLTTQLEKWRVKVEINEAKLKWQKRRIK